MYPGCHISNPEQCIICDSGGAGKEAQRSSSSDIFVEERGGGKEREGKRLQRLM